MTEFLIIGAACFAAAIIAFVVMRRRRPAPSDAALGERIAGLQSDLGKVRSELEQDELNAARAERKRLKDREERLTKLLDENRKDAK